MSLKSQQQVTSRTSPSIAAHLTMPLPSVLPSFITTRETYALGIARTDARADNNLTNTNTASTLSQQETPDGNNEQMDLGWNSDFETSLLNGWGDNTETNSQLSTDDDNNRGKTENLSRLTSFNIDYEASPSEKSKSPVSGKQRLGVTSSDYDSGEQESQNPASSNSGSSSRTGRRPQQLETANTSRVAPLIPLGIAAPVSITTSVSSTKDIVSTGGSSSLPSARSQQHQQNSSSSTTSSFVGKSTTITQPRLHPLAMQSSAKCPSHGTDQALASMPMNPGLHHQQGVYPMNLIENALHDRTAASYAASLASLQQVHQQAMMAPPNKPAAPNPVPTFSPQQNASNYFQPAPPVPVQQQAPHASVTGSSHQQQPPTSKPKKTRSKRKGKQQASANTPPPFYLFDAPIELRANFMQSQRRLGIPVINDCNSYHYGETVKGFHPQGINVTKRDGQQPNTVPVQLIDARHGGNRPGTGRVKNEREQKRAQKITELIDQLRVNMENGGWKVEMRSKFHTLSSCADYVKHLMKATKEKEDEVDTLKADLEVKQNQMEADKALQESRSDPESVTSSLTSATSTSGKGHRSSGNGKKSDSNSKKRKQQGSSKHHESSGAPKKHRTDASGNTSSESTEEETSEGEDRVSLGPSTRNSSIDKTVSSVSDITDSNRGSSNSGSGGEDHGDVVFDNDKKSKRKRPPTEVTSLERSFELDFEEVFDKSNIPQMIAATSGKIVSWNECFLKATGLKKDEVERMTIFSLVRPEKLGSFFEIVAAALRTDEEEDRKGAGSETSALTNSDGGKGGSSDSSERQWDYAAMTLPCIDFPTMKKRQASEPTKHTDPLFVTITLMADEDPKKRCFHCVFTDCPGTNGALGSITPELLALLFTTPAPKRKKSKSSRKHKRARTHHKSKPVREELDMEDDEDLDEEDRQEKGAVAQEIEEEEDYDQLLMEETEKPVKIENEHT